MTLSQPSILIYPRAIPLLGIAPIRKPRSDDRRDSRELESLDVLSIPSVLPAMPFGVLPVMPCHFGASGRWA